MSDLADAVLPLIRTRADLWRWSAANEHGRQMHEAVSILERAADTEDPVVVFAVTQKAIASALKVIMRADDSSAIIGDACRHLLELHPRVAAAAKPPVGKLVDWMMAFHFHNECDYFTIDPVAYAPALGEKGMASYRAKLVHPHRDPGRGRRRRARANTTVARGRVRRESRRRRSTGLHARQDKWRLLSNDPLPRLRD